MGRTAARFALRDRLAGTCRSKRRAAACTPPFSLPGGRVTNRSGRSAGKPLVSLQIFGLFARFIRETGKSGGRYAPPGRPSGGRRSIPPMDSTAAPREVPMHPAPRKRWALAVAVFVGATACSSGGSSKDSGDKSAIGKAKAAVIQIDVTGTFANVDGRTDENQEGRGSGFIISKDGLAVTNNHVVTGATKISVRVPGKADPVPAKVLGASECADLAVIDLDGGGYDALQWATDAPDIGNEVQAVGYPLGVREITLKPGVVEKLKGPAATDWAAVAGVMQHSAEIKPGNSGGPLVNKPGKVVGVNYAGSEAKKEDFAMTAETAKPLADGVGKGET